MRVFSVGGGWRLRWRSGSWWSQAGAVLGVTALLASCELLPRAWSGRLGGEEEGAPSEVAATDASSEQGAANGAAAATERAETIVPAPTTGQGDGTQSAAGGTTLDPREEPGEITGPAPADGAVASDLAPGEAWGWLASTQAEGRFRLETLRGEWRAVEGSTSRALSVDVGVVGTAWQGPKIDVVVRVQCHVGDEVLVDWAVFTINPEKLVEEGGRIASATLFEPAALTADPSTCSVEVGSNTRGGSLFEPRWEVRSMASRCLRSGEMRGDGCLVRPNEVPPFPRAVLRDFTVDWGSDARGRPRRGMAALASLTAAEAVPDGKMHFVRAKCPTADGEPLNLERNEVLGPMLPGETHVTTTRLQVVRPEAQPPDRCDITLHGTFVGTKTTEWCYEDGQLASGACASAAVETTEAKQCAALMPAGEDAVTTCEAFIAKWYEPTAFDTWIACASKRPREAACAKSVEAGASGLDAARSPAETALAVTAAEKACTAIEAAMPATPPKVREGAWRGKAACVVLLSQMTDRGREDMVGCITDNCRDTTCFLSLDACADGEGLGEGP